MLFSFVSILISILWIILGTSVTKIHPFLVLFSAALLLAFLLGISPIETLNLIQGGFGQIIEKNWIVDSLRNRNWSCNGEI